MAHGNALTFHTGRDNAYWAPSGRTCSCKDPLVSIKEEIVKSMQSLQVELIYSKDKLASSVHY